LVLQHLIPSACRPVLANRVFRRLLLGFAISYLGDGMSFVAVAWLAGVLTLPLYVALLAVSSLLHAWGSAGKYTLLAGLMPGEQRLAANTLARSASLRPSPGPRSPACW
jgi:hypothetical protein